MNLSETFNHTYAAWVGTGEQSRRRVLTNKSMAELFGLHSEEALARFAVHDFALPVSEADGIRHFIYDLSTLYPPITPRLVDDCTIQPFPRGGRRCLGSCWKPRSLCILLCILDQ